MKGPWKVEHMTQYLTWTSHLIAKQHRRNANDPITAEKLYLPVEKHYMYMSHAPQNGIGLYFIWYVPRGRSGMLYTSVRYSGRTTLSYTWQLCCTCVINSIFFPMKWTPGRSHLRQFPKYIPYISGCTMGFLLVCSTRSSTYYSGRSSFCCDELTDANLPADQQLHKRPNMGLVELLVSQWLRPMGSFQHDITHICISDAGQWSEHRLHDYNNQGSCPHSSAKRLIIFSCTFHTGVLVTDEWQSIRLQSYTLNIWKTKLWCTGQLHHIVLHALPMRHLSRAPLL